MAKNWNFGRIVLVLWILFSVVFISLTLWNNVLQRAYQQGIIAERASVMQTVSKKCDVIPLVLNGQQVNIINVACLQDPNAEKKAEAPVAPVE